MYVIKHGREKRSKSDRYEEPIWAVVKLVIIDDKTDLQIYS